MIVLLNAAVLAGPIGSVKADEFIGEQTLPENMHKHVHQWE